MRYQNQHFTALQTEVLKGLGILMIVLHNFFHVLLPVVGENEFSFSPENFERFLSALLASPFDIARLFFSYFGHLGVHVFVFLSAYGLTRKYLDQEIKPVEFWKSRFSRIYPSFALCVVLFVMIKISKAVISGQSIDFSWWSLLWKLLLVSNFIPGEAMMPSGPWWFISFIMQFYLIYPWLLAIYRRRGLPALLLLSAGSIALEIIANPMLIVHGLNINHMVFGHLPVICLAVFTAHQKRIEVSHAVTLLAIAVFIAGSRFEYAWLLSDAAFTLMFLKVIGPILSMQNRLPTVFTFLTFSGALSFQMFMVNGFLRPPFVKFAENHGAWWINNLSALAALAFTMMVAYGLRFVDDRLRQKSFRPAFG